MAFVKPILPVTSAVINSVSVTPITGGNKVSANITFNYSNGSKAVYVASGKNLGVNRTLVVAVTYTNPDGSSGGTDLKSATMTIQPPNAQGYRAGTITVVDSTGTHSSSATYKPGAVNPYAGITDPHALLMKMLQQRRLV